MGIQQFLTDESVVDFRRSVKQNHTGGYRSDTPGFRGNSVQTVNSLRTAWLFGLFYLAYENMIAQMIAAKGRKLYFYTRYSLEKHRNDIEIDFLLSNGSKTSFRIFPMEVKSSKNYSTTSLNRFRELFSGHIAHSYIIHPKSYVKEEKITRIPPYMFFCLFR